jgi:hypothetical protein
MTVAELIEKLKELPQDSRVVVDGYEGGLCDVGGASGVTIQLDRNSESWYGPHEEVGKPWQRDMDPSKPVVPAVHIG